MSEIINFLKQPATPEMAIWGMITIAVSFLIFMVLYMKTNESKAKKED